MPVASLRLLRRGRLLGFPVVVLAPQGASALAVPELVTHQGRLFDAQDRPRAIIGLAGDAPGEFNNPWSIALDSKGNLYVADSQNHRVQKLIRRRNP